MFRKKTGSAIIGLDIGTDSIKLLKGIKKEGRIRVLDFAYRKYSASEATPNLISQYIAELLSSAADTKKSRIHATIPGRKLCVRVVRLPVMPKEEIAQAIRSEIRKYVSPDIEQTAFSFFVLGETQEKGVKKMDVVFTAIQKGIFDEYLQYFKLAGSEPAVVTSACFSGWNLVREAGLDRGATSLMLIDIESQETNLTAYREGKFVFTRNVSIGNADFKDKLGLEGENEATVLLKEITLTTHHYYQITHGERIDKCMLLGEGSLVTGLVDFLKQKLEMPVENFSMPEAKLQFSLAKAEDFSKNLPLYAQALGALLVGPGDINLISQMKTRAKKAGYPLISPALHKMTTAAIIGFISLGLAIFVLLKGVNFYYQRQIKSYQLKEAKLENEILQLARIKRKMDILVLEKELYVRLLKGRPLYSVIIAQICKAIPPGKIALDQINFYSEQKNVPSQEAIPAIKFTITGRLLEKGAASSQLTQLVLALEEGGYFENISVALRGEESPAEERASVEEKEKQNFVINGAVKLRGM